MATVSIRHIVDEIIAGDGLYGSEEDGYDPRVIKIVEYNNMFNGDLAWGLIYEGEDLNRYHEAGACIRPRTIWEHSSLAGEAGNGSF
jgi:hypothetical protein